MELTTLTIKDFHKGLVSRDFSCVDVITAHLERIKAVDGQLNAILKTSEDTALDAAAKVDKKVAAGEELGILEGVPVLVKDNILIKGLRATAGSKILENYEAVYSATVIEKLTQAGAIVVGKTNMDEFAMGSSTENSYFGATKNPWDTARIPGGSSGGSAAAIAARMSILALGSDTGGSIRQPAAMCGIVGFKPTYGRVSRYGLMSMASSFDQIGPMTRTVEDAEAMLTVIEGNDANDATSAPESRYENDAPIKDLRGIKIGLPKEYFGDELDPEINGAVQAAIKTLEGLGAKMVEISLPYTKYDLEVYYVLMPSEVSANLERYDGIRYGTRVPGATLKETYLESRGQGFGDEVRHRILLGTYALSSGYYDAYYLKAQKVRALIKRDFEKALEDVDVILSPTSPMIAWKLGEKTEDPIAMYLADLYTVSANVVGAPAVSIPCGFVHHMPIGLQFIGAQFTDRKVLSIAKAYEQVTSWHKESPEL